MKYKLSLLSVALLSASNSWAEEPRVDGLSKLPYYEAKVVTVELPDGAKYGPYPVAMSDDKEAKTIATYSLKASLDVDIDIGLPFTFNRTCQYDEALCELEFYGSENSADASYYNAYQAWRNARLNSSSRKDSYFMSSIIDAGTAEVQVPYAPVGDSDVKITAIYTNDNGDKFVIGYASAPYKADGSRTYARRAFIKRIDGNNPIELLPTFTDEGGFSSAYQIKKVGDKVYVVGSGSVSFPDNDPDYFKRCYVEGDDTDERYGYNELLNCPGFDTQAFRWDVTAIINGGSRSPAPEKLLDSWIENSDNAISTAVAFDINKDGVAVGSSSFEYENNLEGARMRAILIEPSNKKLVLISAATTDIEDEDDNIYNAWAVAINDQGLVLGNRAYEIVKGRNKPIEFFLFDKKTSKINFPLLDKKVLSTKQRLEGVSSYKSGANSRAYAMNTTGFVVGSADDYDQNDPVYDGKPRAQTAFLYDKKSNKSWRLNDLLCTQKADVVEDMHYRLRSARVINDEGTILAEGFEYKSKDDYIYKVNAIPRVFKLTRNIDVISPEDSPNCWDSELLQQEDSDYERSGAGSIWFTLLALPLLLIRRLRGKKSIR
ncbi:DUF3466 family protein [Psychromonas sp. CNPT3]|uniref:DUF3466 family protein n=1 Tax=Psychromonas sp. CNPT3 TaxID=314282 RepID=UPI0002DC35AC|nr:DUF3466 family protein [Psychromonas sp. CNPT3]